MFRNGLQGWHVIVLVVVILLLFGAQRLPGLARSVGESLRIFKKEIKDVADDGTPKDPATGTPVTGTAPGTVTPPSSTMPSTTQPPSTMPPSITTEKPYDTGRPYDPAKPFDKPE